MAKKAEQQESTVLIEIPVAEVPEQAYKTRHIDVCLKTEAQSKAAKMILAGLAGTKTDDGRLVKSVEDCIRWIMEEVSRNIR